MTTTNRTCADRLIDDLAEGGVDYLFVNWGSEHPPLVEALARRDEAGYCKPVPIICPHEMVALSAAQGYAQRTGRAQGLVVHADVGTQNLGGALHNCCRSRTPALILGGVSPHSVLGEEFLGRNEYQMVIQDVPDQLGIVRQYMKWSYHVRSAAHMPMVTGRALEVAASEPAGPVYLGLAREVLEAPAGRIEQVMSPAPSTEGGLKDVDASRIFAALENAEKPVLITSYLGRKPKAVDVLVEFSELFAVPVVESVPYYVNFPATHPHHAGFHAHVKPDPRLAEADLVLVVDSDFPWLPAKERIGRAAEIFHIDVDPAKQNIPLWHVPRTKAFAADAETSLKQLVRLAKSRHKPWPETWAVRSKQLATAHSEASEKIKSDEENQRALGALTPGLVAACLREQLDTDDIVLNEAITSSALVLRHLQRQHAGTLFGSGGSALGWNGGAALGVKLAAPERTVVNITGDGSYIFSIPSATHWVAAKYQIATLTIVLNNGGWRAPKRSTLAIYPDGDAQRTGMFFNELKPSIDFVELSKAAGVKFAKSVLDVTDLEPLIAEALTEVRNGSPALLEIQLADG